MTAIIGNDGNALKKGQYVFCPSDQGIYRIVGFNHDGTIEIKKSSKTPCDFTEKTFCEMPEVVI